MWAVQLSINKSIFRFSFVNFSTTITSHFPNKSAVIHAFLFAAYSRGSKKKLLKSGVIPRIQKILKRIFFENENFDLSDHFDLSFEVSLAKFRIAEAKHDRNWFEL